jgi:superfamily I DNA/RNA helicase
MEANPRVVFTGPAGSGKTLLAIESARRSSARGRSTLFLCYNRLLGRWLGEQTEPLGESVRVGTLHRYLLSVVGLRSAPPGATDTFWRTDLPLLAAERLLEASDDNHLFDEVILDEAQDLLADSYLDVIDLSLRGGWSKGRWRLFGDFEKQAIYDAADVSLENFQREYGQMAPVYQLRLNCRNTPRVAALVRLLGGLNPDYLRILRPDDGEDVALRYYTDANDQQQQLIEVLQQLYDQDISGQDIVILSPRGEGACAARIDTPPWRDRLRPLEQPAQGHISYGTIHSFKGLEASTVIVTDIEHFAAERMQALFYIAVTRATHRLVILAHDQTKSEILAALLGTASGHGGKR